MTVDRNVFLTSMADAIDRAMKKKWSSSLDGEILSRSDALARVAEIFSEQLRDPASAHHSSSNFFDGLLNFGEYFTTLAPAEAEIKCVIDLATSDYYAFQSLALLGQIDAQSTTLKNWKQQCYLGLLAPPRRPSGPGPSKYLHRDNLLISQIRQLQQVGFLATRNKETEEHNSGCDLVVEALALCGVHMSYDAVAAVWKNRDNLKRLTLIARAFQQALATALDLDEGS